MALTDRLVCSGSTEVVEKSMLSLGIETNCPNSELTAMHGGACFDTGRPVDMFSDSSPAKICTITTFPKQYFFVMRAVQLLRGLCTGMDVEYSTARKWKPFAERAVRQP